LEYDIKNPAAYDYDPEKEVNFANQKVKTTAEGGLV